MGDEDLQALRRRVEAEPGNEEAARSYEVALRRAGRVEPLRELYRFRFRCDKRWEDLEETAWPLQRHCTACRKDVHLVTNPAEFAEHARAGHCVSVVDARVDEHLSALAGGDQPVAAKPCVLPSRWQELLATLSDATGRSPNTRNLNMLGQPQFTEYELQVRDVEGGLMAASGHPSSIAAFDEVRRVMEERRARASGLVARIRRWLGRT